MKTKFIVNEPYVICLFNDRKLGRKFKGIAKCSIDDVFDIEKGKQIAKLKAEINREYYRINKADKNIAFIEKKAIQLVEDLYSRLDIYEENLERKHIKILELAGIE